MRATGGRCGLQGSYRDSLLRQTIPEIRAALGDLSRFFSAGPGEFSICYSCLDKRETLHAKAAEGGIGNARGWKGADLLSGTSFVPCRKRLLSIAIRGSRHCSNRWGGGRGNN